ncbi:BRCA1-associated protein [Pluteus cervinus]|uniref:BRCA1-associated protein n=1 Tax=Pluteus cervinus TaxID=181527 RepID=A0ACD3BAS2_9AGAR|nr:BRCA1-associated protein [Pluteus cervinus]
MRGFHIRIAVDVEDRNTPFQNTQSPYKTAVPRSLFSDLPYHKPNPIPAPTVQNTGKDYRLGPIRIDWVDFEEMSSTAFSPPRKRREQAQARGPAEAVFIPQPRKSGSTNLPEGVIHIYRDPQDRPSTCPETALANVSETPDTADSVILAILAVPSWMTPSDFLTFVAPAAEGISHLRIIRDSAPNRSIAVIKFRNPAEASEFAEAYNGKPFNSMEPEICHVVHVLSVEIDPSDTFSLAISRLGSSQGSMYELPTCPVCLERMDSAVTGLITVPCSHTFHCMCLSKWGDSRCPVCRYSQTLLTSHPTASTSTRSIPFASSTAPALSSCSSCSSTTNLWICLICGNIGCGRYGRAHAHAHYQSTAHLYALELETQRVWDYAGDGYVHRLIQNKADGKLVELPSAASSTSGAPRDDGLGPTQADALTAEKIEAIGIEYSYLLTSQLDSQREYYEEQVTDLQTQMADLRELVDKLSHQSERERQAAQETEVQAKKDAEKRIAELAKEKAKIEQRLDQWTELARQRGKQLEEEKAVNKGLVENLQEMKLKVEVTNKLVEDANQKIRDLEDQVRDVMFFLDAKTKIESGEGAGAEAAGGSLEITQPPPPPPSRKKKGSRKG